MKLSSLHGRTTDIPLHYDRRSFDWHTASAACASSRKREVSADYALLSVCKHQPITENGGM